MLWRVKKDRSAKKLRLLWMYSILLLNLGSGDPKFDDVGITAPA
jgi:hypothetical protein